MLSPPYMSSTCALPAGKEQDEFCVDLARVLLVVRPRQTTSVQVQIKLNSHLPSSLTKQVYQTQVSSQSVGCSCAPSTAGCRSRGSSLVEVAHRKLLPVRGVGHAKDTQENYERTGRTSSVRPEHVTRCFYHGLRSRQIITFVTLPYVDCFTRV